MNTKHTDSARIADVKSRATKRQAAEGIPRKLALNLAAQELGFANYDALRLWDLGQSAAEPLPATTTKLTPANTNTFDPFATIRGIVRDAEGRPVYEATGFVVLDPETVGHLRGDIDQAVETIVPKLDADSAYWRDSAAAIVAGIITLVHSHKDPAQIAPVMGTIYLESRNTLNIVEDVLCLGTEAISDLAAAIMALPDNGSPITDILRRFAAQVGAAGPKELGSLISSALICIQEAVGAHRPADHISAEANRLMAMPEAEREAELAAFGHRKADSIRGAMRQILRRHINHDDRFERSVAGLMLEPAGKREDRLTQIGPKEQSVVRTVYNQLAKWLAEVINVEPVSTEITKQAPDMRDILAELLGRVLLWQRSLAYSARVRHKVGSGTGAADRLAITGLLADLAHNIPDAIGNTRSHFSDPSYFSDLCRAIANTNIRISDDAGGEWDRIRQELLGFADALDTSAQAKRAYRKVA